MLRKNYPARADRTKGKFRTFLLQPLNQFLFDQQQRSAALKRGGGQRLISLSEELVAQGKGAQDEVLRTFEPGEQNLLSYTGAATRLGVTESAVKSMIHRLRQRHRELVREEIAQTVPTAANIDHLLTGRAPFVAPAVADTLARVQTADPVSPTVLNPHLPRDLKTICLKCLKKEPGRRYQSAQELADDLGHFLRGETILARPVGPAGKTWRWCRRKPLVAILSAAVVLVFLLGFAGMTWQARRATQARDLAQGRLYAAQMKLAHAAIKEGKTGNALAMLRAPQPRPGQRDLRGFDWRYLYRLCLDSPE